MNFRVLPPDLTDCRSCEVYRKELAIWDTSKDIPKEKRGAILAARLPDESKLKKDLAKFFEIVDVIDLAKEGDLRLVEEFLERELGEVDLEKQECTRGTNDIEEFLSDFDGAYKKAEAASKFVIPASVRAIMVLKRANIDRTQRMRVLSKLDKSDEVDMFDNMHKEIKIVLGRGPGANKSINADMKVEQSNLPSEEVIYVAGYYRREGKNHLIKKDIRCKDEMDGEYKGEWKPRQVDNPDYNPADTEEIAKYEENCKIGIDLWQVKSAAAKKAGVDLWAVTKEAEKKMKDEQDEEERKKADEEAKKDKDDEEADDLDQIKGMEKMHRQFGHTNKEKFRFMKDANNLSSKLGVIDKAEIEEEVNEIDETNPEERAAIEVPNTTETTEEHSSQNYENIEADEDDRKRKCMGRPVDKKLAINGESIVIVAVDRIVEQGQEITKESMELGEIDKADSEEVVDEKLNEGEIDNADTEEELEEIDKISPEKRATIEILDNVEITPEPNFMNDVNIETDEGGRKRKASERGETRNNKSTSTKKDPTNKLVEDKTAGKSVENDIAESEEGGEVIDKAKLGEKAPVDIHDYTEIVIEQTALNDDDIETGEIARKRKASELPEAVTRISKRPRAVGQHPPSRAEKIHSMKDDLIQINLDEDWLEFRKVTEEEVNMGKIPREEQNNDECKNAKVVELEKLKIFVSFEEVDDKGQYKISCRWILWKKGTEVRTWLLNGGFEDEEVVHDYVPEHCDSDDRLEYRFETEALQEFQDDDPEVIAESEDCPTTPNCEKAEHRIVKDLAMVESSEESEESDEVDEIDEVKSTERNAVKNFGRLGNKQKV